VFSRSVAVPHQENPFLDDGQGRLAPAGSEDPSEGRTGDSHASCGLLLVQPLYFGQPECLQLVEAENNHRQIPRGSSKRPEPLSGETATDAARYGRTSHDNF